MKLIDVQQEWESVTLPGFDKIMLGQELQDIDLEVLQATWEKFPIYCGRLVLDDSIEAPQQSVAVAAPEPVAVPMPEPTPLTAEPVEDDKPQPPKKFK